MAVLEAVLALIGLVAIGGVGACWCFQRSPNTPAVEGDLAAPYREALHSGIRLQTVAQDLEQQIYAEAIRRANEDPGGGLSCTTSTR